MGAGARFCRAGRGMGAGRGSRLCVAEPPKLLSYRSTCLPLDTKYSREDTKLHSSVEHTPRENLKIHIFPLGP